MGRHRVPELLRQVSDLCLPASPPPSRFSRHADVIDPIAEAYTDIYQARYGFPFRAEALERFLEPDLKLPYSWQDIPEPRACAALSLNHATLGGWNGHLTPAASVIVMMKGPLWLPS
jgi:hypothetical protein